MKTKLPPIHPGEILVHEFLAPLAISQNRLAREIDVPVSRIAGIVKGERAITADTALRLGRYFSTHPQFWLAMQNTYDLAVVEDLNAARIAERVHPLNAA